MGFGSSSCWAKMALVCIFLGTIMDIAGFATTSWIVYTSTDGQTTVNVGLWTLTSCSASTCSTVTVTDAYITDLFNAMRILETIGLVMAIFMTFFLLFYTCVDTMKTQNIARVAMALCFIAGLILFVGMCLCLAYVPLPYIVGYSMGLTVLGYLLILIAGSLLIPDSCEPKDYDY